MYTRSRYLDFVESASASNSKLQNASMGSDKGKHRAVDDDAVNPPPPDAPGDSSMVSRVAASATGLARSAFASPGGNHLSQSTAAALANAGKGQSSEAAGSSTWAESSRASHQATPQTGSSNAFRPSQNEEHIRQSEQEFSSFLDGIDAFTPSQDLADGHPEDPSGGFNGAWTQSQPTVFPPEHRTIAEQEGHDGDDVLAILSSPDEIDPSFEVPPEDIPMEDYDWGLAPEQLTQLRAITKDLLPAPEPHAVPSPHNPLNLLPRADQTNLVNGESRESVEAWRDQWEDVLTRYSDEVWGGLLPLVKEARKEVEELQSGEGPTMQPKALRRLGAVLGHLREY